MRPLYLVQGTQLLMHLIGTRTLPCLGRRLLEWEMVGRGLNREERRRGAVISREKNKSCG